MDVHFFERFSVQHLLGNHNVCAPDWGETNCRYRFHKFYYFLEGSCTLEIEGTAFHPQPGELFLIPAETTHSYRHEPENPVRKYWCHFSAQTEPEYRFGYHRASLCCTPPALETTALFELLLRPAPVPGLLPLQQQHALTGLLLLFLEGVPHDHLLLRETDTFTRTMRAYIAENLTRPLSLQELAGCIPLHPNHFIRCFKHNFGMTPVEYVQEMRLLRSRSLLEAVENPSIADIAEACGFNDCRYYTRLFRRRYGMTPSLYRKYHRNGLQIPLISSARHG